MLLRKMYNYKGCESIPKILPVVCLVGSWLWVSRTTESKHTMSRDRSTNLWNYSLEAQTGTLLLIRLSLLHA